ncbi:MAG TPA: SPFH/Band 7/PHB domain protein [Thermopetrobacter sp.]|nr:SPFH/Band 7/PHB domain protein [Thermopetrobacter sp.]
MEGFSIFALILVLLVLATLYMGIVIVPQGHHYTVERFGKYIKTLHPGFHIIIPWFDRISNKVNVMEQVLEVPSQEVITRDNAMVTVDGIAYYQVIDAARATYEVNRLEYAMINLVLTNIRTVMGSMDLDQLLSHRDEINARILAVVDEASGPWGVKVTRIEIKDILPPQDLVDAMAQQMIAERNKRAVILEAEGVRQSQILKAEGEKQATILKAEGEREAAWREAEARERLAQAEAAATKVVSTAIAEGDVRAINYFVANNYVKALEQVASAPNEKVIMMPLEASSVIGSIAGISELAKEAFGGKGKA